MAWRIPGTLLECSRSEADKLEARLTWFPALGGFSMRHITELTGLEAYTVQNWVKRGFLAPPVNRSYTVDQLCRIILIGMLKGIFPMDKICRMLTYVNGKMDDTTDDIIPDSKLYFMFVRLAARAREMDQDPEGELDRVLAEYTEPVPGAGARIRKVLRIMLIGWLACRMKQEAETQMEDFLKGEMNNE